MRYKQKSKKTVVKTKLTEETNNETKNETNVETIVETKSDLKTENNLISISDSDLIEKIKENDKYFSALIDLIPPKIYFEGNEEILESIENQKKQRFGDDLNLSAKAKQKRFKLDPNSDKTVSEIANNFYNNKSNQKKKKSKLNSKDDKMSELKQILSEKISKLKSIRGQKRNAKQLREPKKERKKLNSMRAHKQKGFKKRSILDISSDSKNTNHESSEPKPKRLKHDVTDGGAGSKSGDKGVEKMPKIYNSSGNIVYSKFDFVSPIVESKEAIRKTSKKNKLKKLLVKTKKEEEKLTQLEATDAPKAKLVKEKKLWRNAIEKSEGIKVKNNSKLIEKSLNKRKKLKQKSGQKWTERKESLDQRMKAKSDKRMKNIDQRKQQRKDRKISKAKKKGRILPKT